MTFNYERTFFDSLFGGMGLAEIADANPTWEKTPILARIVGKPKWRYWRYRTGEWVYAHVKPASAYYGGINRSSNPIWRTSVYNPPSDSAEP